MGRPVPEPVKGEYEPLLGGLVTESCGAILDQLAEVERLAIELQFAPVQPGKVEDIIDDSEQILGRLPRGQQVILLSFAEGSSPTNSIIPNTPLSGVRNS